MSILSGARDVLSLLAFERALGRVRDQQLQRMLDGRPMSDDELRQAEREAALATARQLYADDTALAMGLARAPGERDHRRDYAARSSAPAEVAALSSHHALCRLPIVGDPSLVSP